MARRERSAGVIVFHREPRNKPITFLVLDYGRHWDYAKGHVDKGEDDLSAALRELREETGIENVKLMPDFAREIVYFFRHPRRGLIRKEVIFFLGETASTKVKISHEHVGYAFLAFEEALKKVTFPTAKQVLREAHDYLEQHSPSA